VVDKHPPFAFVLFNFNGYAYISLLFRLEFGLVLRDERADVVRHPRWFWGRKGGEPEKAKEGTFLWLFGGMGTGIAPLKKNGRLGNLLRGRHHTKPPQPIFPLFGLQNSSTAGAKVFGRGADKKQRRPELSASRVSQLPHCFPLWSPAACDEARGS
jgi:hypothetical protein